MHNFSSPSKANEQSKACIRNILTYATPCRYMDFCTFIPFGSSLTALRSLLVLEKFTQCVNFARKLLELHCVIFVQGFVCQHSMAVGECDVVRIPWHFERKCIKNTLLAVKLIRNDRKWRQKKSKLAPFMKNRMSHLVIGPQHRRRSAGSFSRTADGNGSRAVLPNWAELTTEQTIDLRKPRTQAYSNPGTLPRSKTKWRHLKGYYFLCRLYVIQHRIVSKYTNWILHFMKKKTHLRI